MHIFYYTTLYIFDCCIMQKGWLHLPRKHIEIGVRGYSFSWSTLYSTFILQSSSPVDLSISFIMTENAWLITNKCLHPRNIRCFTQDTMHQPKQLNHLLRPAIPLDCRNHLSLDVLLSLSLVVFKRTCAKFKFVVVNYFKKTNGFSIMANVYNFLQKSIKWIRKLDKSKIIKKRCLR